MNLFMVRQFKEFDYSCTMDGIRAVHRLGRVRLVPDPNSTRYFQVDKIKTRNRLRILIRSASSGRFRFWVVSVNFKFRHGGRDLARSVEIWPDPSRSSRYLAKIHGDLADIWPDPSRSHRILKDLD